MGAATSHEPLDRSGVAGVAAVAETKEKKERGSGSDRPLKKMDRLRRSFRDSFRKKREHVPEAAKPHQWQADEAAVRAGTCSFHVRYLGCVEVFESRGMQVCEEALKVLRNSRRRPVKAILYVSGDGLRVVEDETKGLIVDQTIEKVSFCAPDRNHEKGFSYICRDGTTRRWMCHGFLALKESGERLSHAVGCAFAACLERKQRRDKECGVSLSFDPTQGSFSRLGSFRQVSLPERSHTEYALPSQDPQECKPAPPPPPLPATNRPVHNPYAIERPHATPLLLQRQGSFRAFSALGAASPFKRQLSLRLAELPSNLQRQRAMSLGSAAPNGNPPHSHGTGTGSNIRTLSPPVERPSDPVSALCQQVTRGLTLLTSASDDSFQQAPLSGSQPDLLSAASLANSPPSGPTSAPLPSTAPAPPPPPPTAPNSTPAVSTTTTLSNSVSATPWDGSWTNPAAIWNSSAVPAMATTTAVPPTAGLPRPDQWLGSVSSSAAAMGGGHKRAPHISHLRSQSLGTAESLLGGMGGQHLGPDPFDAEWAALAARQSATNPFTSTTNAQVTATFEVPL